MMASENKYPKHLTRCMPKLFDMKIICLQKFLRLISLPAEIRFPHGCWLYFLLSPLVMAAETPQEVLVRLQNGLQTQGEHWRQQPGWDALNFQIENWVAKGAENLPACDQPVTTDLADRPHQFWGQYQYQIRCAAPAWTYKARLTVKATLPVWTARTSLKRDHVLNAADLSLVPVDLNQVRRGFLTSADTWLDFRLLHRVQAGEVLKASDLKSPLLVQKGQTVTLKVGVDGFQASMSGESQENGTLGEQIKVRNLSSQRIVTGIVSGKQEVTIHY